MIQDLLYSGADTFDGIVLQQDPSMDLLDPSRHRFLLARLRIKHHWGGHIQTFGDAVHAAVGEEDVCSRKNIELIHIRIHPDAFRQCSQRLAVDRISAGDDHVGLQILQRFNAFGVEIRLIVEYRSQRDIDQRTHLILVGLRFGKQRGPDKGIMIRKAFRIRLEAPGGVNDGIHLVVALDQ